MTSLNITRMGRWRERYKNQQKTSAPNTEYLLNLQNQKKRSFIPKSYENT